MYLEDWTSLQQRGLQKHLELDGIDESGGSEINVVRMDHSICRTPSMLLPFVWTDL
jgi:hypothetical protein